jgi:Flp pilus assembly protein protease CpaA
MYEGMVFASLQDIKSREVANWINFSLIIFALGFRFFWSLFSETSNGFSFFYQGLIGLGIFLIVGNLFYYSRVFAGGDAKLMIALGAILPFSSNFKVNLEIFVEFFIIFILVGAIYGLVWSLFLALKNFGYFKKDYRRELKKNKKLIFLCLLFGLVLVGFSFFEFILVVFGIFILIIPYFYLFAQSIDRCCMVVEIPSKKLREGDWLFQDLKISKNKLIKKNWEGLSKKEIKLIQGKFKSVKIKQGIAFVPVFLISFLILLFILFF